MNKDELLDILFDLVGEEEIEKFLGKEKEKVAKPLKTDIDEDFTPLLRHIAKQNGAKGGTICGTCGQLIPDMGVLEEASI